MRRTPRRLGLRMLALLGPIVVAIAATTATPALSAGGTVTGNKTASATSIQCNGSVNVTVTLNGQTGIAGTPQDIELVLDRSGSMAGTPLANLKTAANHFVDTIDEATDGLLDGVIANGSRVGVVSFGDSATVNVPLTTNAMTLKTAISGLVAGGNTNHQAAISTAQAQLAGSNPASGKTMIIFTDGQTTVGGNGQAEAAAARAAGTTIYAIGLGSVNVAQLNGWATDPDSTHVFIAPSSGDLDAIFAAIGAAIIVPAATNITVVDTASSHFAVSNVGASKGTASALAGVITWTIASLGTESVTLTYTLTHDATKPGGIEALNQSVTYADTEGHTVSFPSPTVQVHGCPATIDVTPDFDVNELVPGASHSVRAAVLDDFGDPLAGIPVSFSIISGPNSGKTGSGVTAGSPPFASFTYLATQGLAGLGTDSISGCFVNNAGATLCDTVQKRWQDTTPPSVSCSPTTNPSGANVPPAGNNPRSGQNPDGFYVLGTSDLVDPNPRISIADSDSSAVFGPFGAGTTIKLVQAPGATPSIKPGAGVIDWKVTLKGDALVSATDASGNTSAPVSCKVPPPPK